MAGKIDEIDSRLRTVEQAVTRIDERIQHMPTTVQAWAMVAVLAGSVWMIAQFAGPPIIKAAVSAVVADQAR